MREPRNRPSTRGTPPTARAFAVLVLLATATTAAAHPDEVVFDGLLEIAPGESLSLPLAVHFHRLVATYEVTAGGPIDLEIVPLAREGGDAGGTLYRDSLAGTGRLHTLIDCCRDGYAYADFTLVLRNGGTGPARLDGRAWLVHDDFAVVATRAEPGAIEVPGLLFLGLGVGALVVAGRARRRRDLHHGATAKGATVVERAYRWSLAIFLAAIAAAALLGTAGALRYGSDPVVGMIAIMADLDVPGGLFGSRAAFLMSVLLLAWLVSVTLWIVAVRRGAGPHLVRLGLALATVHMLGGLALAWSYGEWLVPVALALALAVPLAVSAGLASGRAGVAPPAGVAST